MRHRKVGKILGRKRAPRKALMCNLATSFILSDKIKTTEAKAKALRAFVEKLITLSKTNNLTTRRRLIVVLKKPEAVKKALEVIGPKYKERAGGYTRIIKLGRRRGDAAKMAQIELV